RDPPAIAARAPGPTAALPRDLQARAAQLGLVPAMRLGRHARPADPADLRTGPAAPATATPRCPRLLQSSPQRTSRPSRPPAIAARLANPARLGGADSIRRDPPAAPARMRRQAPWPPRVRPAAAHPRETRRT